MSSGNEVVVVVTGQMGPPGPQGPAGTSDHGLLTGLADDDHTQYARANGTRWTTSPAANRVVVSDATGTIISSSVTSTELGYLAGVSSNIQSQLDSKSSVSHTHTLNDLSDVTITGAAAGQAVIYNGSAWVNGAVDLADADAVTGILSLAKGGTSTSMALPTGQALLTWNTSGVASWLQVNTSDGLEIDTANGLLKNVGYGKQTIWIPASAMTSRTSNGPSQGTTETTTNKVMYTTFDFDPSTDEFVQVAVAMPKSWNEGNLTAKFYWTTTATSGDVVWAVQAVAISDDDALDAAFGTATTVTDTVLAAGDLHQTSETSSFTAAGSPVAGDWVVFQIFRDADNSADTLAADAKLLGVQIFYTTDALTDV